MNVAQLKPRCQPRSVTGCDWFPRLNERGSIEADHHSSWPDTGKRFPRLNERGSIEALRNNGQVNWTLERFPRLNERGSIEATPSGPQGPSADPRFHV